MPTFLLYAPILSLCLLRLPFALLAPILGWILQGITSRSAVLSRALCCLRRQCDLVHVMSGTLALRDWQARIDVPQTTRPFQKLQMMNRKEMMIRKEAAEKYGRTISDTAARAAPLDWISQTRQAENQICHTRYNPATQKENTCIPETKHTSSTSE